MLKSYFRTAARRLTTHKLFSVINVFCLAIGLGDGSGGGHMDIFPSGGKGFTSMLLFGVDKDFAKVYDIQMKEGVFCFNSLSVF